MKDQAIIEALLHQGNKIVHGIRRFFRIQLRLNRALRERKRYDWIFHIVLFPGILFPLLLRHPIDAVATYRLKFLSANQVTLVYHAYILSHSIRSTFAGFTRLKDEFFRIIAKRRAPLSQRRSLVSVRSTLILSYQCYADILFNCNQNHVFFAGYTQSMHTGRCLIRS